MPDHLTIALEGLSSARQSFLAELAELVAIRSCSGSAAEAGELQRAADWLAARLKRLGAARLEIIPTAANPLVFAELPCAQPEAPTVLIYGHYDVVPPEPLEDWHSDPFVLTPDGEYLHARGASDMKAQLLACIFAAEAAQRSGGMALNLKFLFEGNEEYLPNVLNEFIPANRELLACDISLNADAGMLGKQQPTIVYGLRGRVTCTLRINGPTVDVHDGLAGGLLENPLHVLARVVADLHDQHKMVTIPGFYEGVRLIDEEERALLARVPFDEQSFLETTGAPQSWGVETFLPIERIGAQPAANMLYLSGGMKKGAIPSQAEGRFSLRLVPDQDPHKIYAALLDYLAARMPATVTWDVELGSAYPPVLVSRSSPWVQSLSAALEATWGVEPLFTRIGGGIPVVANLQQHLGVDSLLTGFSLPGDNFHGPNERVHLPTLERGMQALARFLLSPARR